MIPALAGSSYLNMSYGPKPTPVVDEVVRLARLTEADGTLNPAVQAELWKRYDDAKGGVARPAGCGHVRDSDDEACDRGHQYRCHRHGLAGPGTR